MCEVNNLSSKNYFIKSTLLYYAYNIILCAISFAFEKYAVIWMSLIIGIINIPVNLIIRHKYVTLYNEHLVKAMTCMLMSINLLIASFIFIEKFSVFEFVKVIVWLCLPIVLLHLWRNRTPNKKPLSRTFPIAVGFLILLITKYDRYNEITYSATQFSYMFLMLSFLMSVCFSTQFWVWKKEIDDTNKKL